MEFDDTHGHASRGIEFDDGHARPRVESDSPIEAGEQSELAPIEIRRLENIARNKQLLFDLGIESAQGPSSGSGSALPAKLQVRCMVLRRKGFSWRRSVCLQSGSRFSKSTTGSEEKRENESCT
jgi:hypothetical protein